MEVRVGIDALLQAVRFGCGFPVGQMFAYLLRVPVGVPFGGFSRNGGFEYPSYLIQFTDVGAFHALLYQGRCVLPYHECAGSLAYLQESQIGEDADRLPDGGAADAEKTHQFRFGRQFLSGAEPAFADLRLQAFCKLFRQWHVCVSSAF